MKNGLVASMQRFLSLRVRFDPIVERISFLVFASPLANLALAAQANSNVFSESLTHCLTRRPTSWSSSSKTDFFLSNSARSRSY